MRRVLFTCGGGQGDEIPGELGPGTGRHSEKLRNIVQYFAVEKSAKRSEPTRIEQEPGL